MKKIISPLKFIWQIIDKYVNQPFMLIGRALALDFRYLWQNKRSVLGAFGIVVLTLVLWPFLRDTGNCFTVAYEVGNTELKIFFTLVFALAINVYLLNLLRIYDIRETLFFQILGSNLFILSFAGYLMFLYWPSPSVVIRMSVFDQVAPDFNIKGFLILMIFFVLDVFEIDYFCLRKNNKGGKRDGYTGSTC